MARLPVDVNAEGTYSPNQKLKVFMEASTPDFEEIKESRKTLAERVKKNIATAQAKQKKYYDKKHSGQSSFGVGCVVLKKDFTRKKRRGRKLDYRWEGPYRIVASLGKGLYQLKRIEDSKV